MTARLRMAAIDFLNPAPLMWDFEHPPRAAALAERYAIQKMTPAACAAALAESSADVGLIPIAAYATIPGLAIVPGCAIASLGSIRSLLLIVRGAPGISKGEEPELDAPTLPELDAIRTVALDTASRTTATYTQILFRKYWRHTPRFRPHPPELDAMLQTSDAAVLIGDPALYALRDREARFARTGEPLRYLDLGHLWRQATGTAWVSAFWAMRQAALETMTEGQRAELIEDFARSRDAGLAHIPELAEEWSQRLSLKSAVIRKYLGDNIHYLLDDASRAGIDRFYQEAHALELLPAVKQLGWV